MCRVKLHLQVAQLKADGQWECWEFVPLIRPPVRGALLKAERSSMLLLNFSVWSWW